MVLLTLGGCASPRADQPVELVFAPGRYLAAFDAGRASLIDLGFELERVDARLGIIVTRAKGTAGLASPWDREQSSLGQECEDLVNRHYRRATITFRIPDTPEHTPPLPQTMPGQDPPDLREIAAPVVARVEVSVERLRRPGWRLQPTLMRMSSQTMDPDLRPRGMWPQYTVPFTQDVLLAQRIAARIEARVARHEMPSPEEKEKPGQ
jgi:hypothetical protein